RDEALDGVEVLGEKVPLAVPLEVAVRPAGEAGVLGRGLALPVLAREKAALEGEEGDEGEAECAARRERPLRLRRAVEQVVLVLERDEPGALRGGGGLAELLRGEVRAGDLAHLPLLHERLQRAERLGDGRL